VEKGDTAKLTGVDDRRRQRLDTRGSAVTRAERRRRGEWPPAWRKDTAAQWLTRAEATAASKP
jgi:phage terminase Nu1 subunit (DNA packaging protein)